MLASFAELLQAGREQGRALGAFTCYNFETAMAVLQAAQTRQSSVILLISEKSFASPQGPSLIVGLRAIAELAPIPVCLQLDHVDDLHQIEAAFRLGIGAAMADGSRLPFKENIAFTREAVSIARRYNGEIEAELGRIEGNEDLAAASQAGALTDPDQAAYFVEQAAPSCLAVSIGNVHGHYHHPPMLDWERLRQIQQRIPTVLSLHGASGLPDSDLLQAIRLGISKINVNTELRTCYLQTTAEVLPSVISDTNLLKLQQVVTKALTEVVDAKLRVYERL